MVNHQGTPSRDSEVGIWEPLTDAGHEYLSRFCQSYALMSIKSWREPGLGVAIVMNFKPSINLVKGHYFVTIRLQKGTLTSSLVPWGALIPQIAFSWVAGEGWRLAR